MSRSLCLAQHRPSSLSKGFGRSTGISLEVVWGPRTFRLVGSRLGVRLAAPVALLSPTQKPNRAHPPRSDPTRHRAHGSARPEPHRHGTPGVRLLGHGEPPPSPTRSAQSRWEREGEVGHGNRTGRLGGGLSSGPICWHPRLFAEVRGIGETASHDHVCIALNPTLPGWKAGWD